MYIENQKYQWSNSFSCTWVLGNHCAGSQRWHSHQMGQMWMQFKGMHACWLIISGRGHAEWVAVSRGPPPLFSFADFKESRKTKTNYQPLLLPHRPTQCCEVFIYMGNTFPSIHQKKDEKAFGNMKDDYGNNSINERVRSMAKLFCDLLVIWGYSNSHKEAG